MVSLHACDTATDAGARPGARWEAEVILAVPCCHKEAYGQIRSDVLPPLLRHGLAKERFAALLTDTLRAQLLELAGYRTQLVEFVDLEHTPRMCSSVPYGVAGAGRGEAECSTRGFATHSASIPRSNG